LGSPHGLERSVSLGIVSVTGRHLADMGKMVSPYNTWIQTDAAINLGNSGGPLVNLKGEVVGVNARTMRGADNVGFAIPSDTAKDVIAAIREHGRVVRGWVGIILQETMQVTDDPSLKGVIIADVHPLSPAFGARIRPGDILLAVNGEPVHARFVEDLPAVRKRIADAIPGSTITLTVTRGGQVKDFELVAEEKSDLEGEQVELAEWGFSVSELTPGAIRRARLPSKDGVLVSGAQRGGIADNSGLDPNDILLTVDGQKITDLASFKRMYDDVVASEKRLTLLEVKDGTRALTRYVLVKQEKQGGAGESATAEPNP